MSEPILCHKPTPGSHTPTGPELPWKGSYFRHLTHPAFIGAGIPAREPLTVTPAPDGLREIGFKLYVVYPERYEIQDDGSLWAIYPDGTSRLVSTHPEALQNIHFL